MASKTKFSKLEKLKMPTKRKSDEELDLAQMSEDDAEPMEATDSGSTEGNDSPEFDEMEAGLEDSAPSESEESASNPALEAASDDELVAELKKRGLMGELEGEPHSEAGESETDDSQEIYS